MSKKAFTIFILFILFIMGVLGWYLFFRSEAVPGEDTGGSSFSDLFPFGQKPTEPEVGSLISVPGETASTTIDLSGTGDSEGEGGVLPRLRQISSVPTAGAIAFDVGSTTIVRYIERATGHIYETENSKTDIKKVSNTTIPKIHEALWSLDGARLLIRYVKDDGPAIRTFYARIATTTRPEQALEGIFLADDLREISVSGGKIFYMNETSSGSTGVLANIDGSGRATVFNSSFSDWRSSLTSPTTAVIFPRPSGSTAGSAYILDIKSGSYSKVAGDLPGLVALSNSDGSRVLVSAVLNRSLATVAYDSRGKSENLSVETIADKCVWSVKNKNVVFCAVPQSLPSGVYPDDWYKGKISFDDSLWRIDTANGETENLMSPELETGISMDIFKLSMNKSETVLVFTNRKDMSVWSYSLE